MKLLSQTPFFENGSLTFFYFRERGWIKLGLGRIKLGEGRNKLSVGRFKLVVGRIMLDVGRKKWLQSD